MKKKKLIVEFKFFLPIFLGIIISISIITYFSISTVKINANSSIKTYLELEVKTLRKIFKRESKLKLEKVKTFLKVANDIFHSKKFEISDKLMPVTAINQITKEKHNLKINKWIIDKKEIQYKSSQVDKIQNILNCTATIFQKIDKGYLRISTNVLRSDGKRALFTYIPYSSPVIKAIENGNPYYGRAFVVNEWYITAYEPIKYNNEIVGMLYVGVKEKDLHELSDIFKKLKIGVNGYSFVFDEKGKTVINPLDSGKNEKSIQKIISLISTDSTKKTNNIFSIKSPDNGKNQLIAYTWFEDFKYYIVSSVFPDEEIKEIITGVIISYVIIAVLAILLLSFVIYFGIIDKFIKSLKKLEVSKKELTHVSGKLKSTQNALAQSEKLATMGQLSAGIAHEVNNPLGVVLMYSHLLLDETDINSDIYSDLKIIASNADRCKNILSGLLNFARKKQLVKKETNISNLIETVLTAVIIPNTVEIKINHKYPDFIAYIDSDQITQVLSNLIKNAIDAMKSTGIITLTTSGDSDKVTISVKDNGPGIPKENLSKLFEPFFTTKQIGKGTGLGLAVCYGIIKMHRGTIIINSNNDKLNGETGTEFVITLPRNE